MIPRFKPQYDWREWRAALSFWSKGNIPRYEEAFAKKFECRHGIMFAHGRSGLFGLLNVWGLKNAEVICPAYTCVVVPNAIVLSGNKPVFVDCAEGHFNMDIEGIRAAITEKTRAIIPTHLFGYPMDVHAVQAIADEASRNYGHKVHVIQDCAHSYGARWQGELVTKFGDAAIFGSNISKLINSIFGGMVTTNDASTAEALHQWRHQHLKTPGWRKELRRLTYFVAVNVAFNETIYGFVNWLERKGFLDRFVKYYDEGKIDLPTDWDEWPAEIEARVGLEQLAKYDRIIETRRSNAMQIITEMEGRSDIHLLPFDEGATYSHLVGLVDDRGYWVQEYHKQGVQLGILIEYVVPFMKGYGYVKHGFSVAASRMNKTINLPVYL